MEDDNPLNRIRKATRKKLDEIQEAEIIQEITNTIGDRRIRDLVDIIAREEISKGWNTVVEFLIKSGQNKYPVPVGHDTLEIKVEPIKYREVIFEVFGCAGWEPVNKNTDKLLEGTYNAVSGIDAATIITNEVVALLEEQIERNDALFFNPSDFNHNIPDTSVDAITKLQRKEIDNLKITQQGNTVFVSPLWITEYGRKTLSNLGVKGNTTTKNEYDMVLSVLQVSSSVKENLQPVEGKITVSTKLSDNPSNQLYNRLLQSIINQDTEELVNLGSRHSFSVLNYSMRNAIDQYKSNDDSNSYRILLASIRDHISVRNPESIQLLDEVALESDSRLVTPSILALGNFYDEAAVSALVSIICSKKSPEVRKSCISSIENLRKRCPETQIVVKSALSLECRYATELRRYYRKTWEK
ncbi:MAG: HEAT repeat domain-containing protein [Candidatus Thorarchaeota archaeon]